MFRKPSKTKKAVPKVFRQKGVEQKNKKITEFFFTEKNMFTEYSREEYVQKALKKQRNC